MKSYGLLFGMGVALIGGALGCERQPMRIEVAGAESSLDLHTPGEIRNIQITAFDENGAVIADPGTRWYSTNPHVAEVSKAGVVTAKGEGTTNIIVRAGYTQRTVPVEVRYYASIQPSETELMMTAGETRQLHADVYDANGAAVENAKLSWIAGDPAIASIDDDGWVTATDVGTTKIVVGAGPLTREIVVHVEPSFEDRAS